MYMVRCMFPDGMIMELGIRETAAKAKELRDAFRKQRVLSHRGEWATEFWYQREGAELPEYIENIRWWIHMRG